MARADMHCHSLHSDRPVHWIFYRMGARESYVTPDDLYHRLKDRGMDFVTITDHDSVEGAVEVAEKYDDAFVSCEFTVRFYKDQMEVHLCAYDITEEQYRMGRKLSHDLQEFIDYFRQEDVLVTVPHPLHNNRGQLEVEHLEQLVLLCEYFEEHNGIQMEVANRMQRQFLDGLTPGIIEDLARKHGIQPCFEDPWIKGRLGGTDDHSAFFLGRAWTEVDGADDYKAFLRGIREKRSRGTGQSATALEFAHLLQSNLGHALIDACGTTGSPQERLASIVSRTTSSASEGMGLSAQDLLALVPAASLFGLFQDWQDKELLFKQREDRDLQEDTFAAVSNTIHAVYRYAFAECGRHFKSGEFLQAFSKLSLIAPAAAPVIAFIMGYKHFYSDNHFRRRVATRFGLDNPFDERPGKWAWFTDTLLDINGVARTIQRVSSHALEHNTPITAVTCHPEEPPFQGHIVNFEPLYHFALPEYESMVVAIPPLLDVLRFCEKEEFTRFIISTPGPVGLVALGVANILGIPVSAIYHTDLPAYAFKLTNDRVLQELAWTLVRFFYGQADQVYVLTKAYRDILLDNGLEHDDIRIFPKGTDVDRFTPDRRDPAVWRQWGLGDAPKILYVGRVSKEKDLDILHESFVKLRERGMSVDLIVVGDGPYREELQEELAGVDGVVFPGFVEGDDLADLFASADLLAFPSTTDTYGSVVLEAQASGIPVVVSDKGGPKEAIVDQQTGLVTQGRNVDSFSAALARLVEDEALRRQMGKAGREHVAHKSWASAFQAFWTAQQELRYDTKGHLRPHQPACDTCRK